MNNFPNKETVELIRQKYPPGTRVELEQIDDPYTKLVPGDRGFARFVDDTGTIFVDWDSGSGLGILYGVDYIKKVEEVSVLDAIKAGRQSQPQTAPPNRRRQKGAER